MTQFMHMDDRDRNYARLLESRSMLRTELGLDPDADIPPEQSFQAVREQIEDLKGQLGHRPARKRRRSAKRKRQTFPCDGCGETSVEIEGGICRICAMAAAAASLGTERFARMRARIRKYGINPSDYAHLHMLQRGACAVCHEPAVFGDLVVDHDHDTGEVRGLLCGRCNSGLGFLKDDRRIVRQAVTYLAHPPARRLPTPAKRLAQLEALPKDLTKPHR